MKTTKTLISTLSVAALAVAFSACGSATNTTANNSAANKANNTIIVTNANTANANSTNTTNTNPPANIAPTAEDARFKGEYMVGDVKCTVKPDSSDLMHEIKCADKDKVQNYSRDDAPPKAIIVSSDNEKARFVFDDAMNLANGNFTDETGKTVKVSRVK